MRPRGRWSVTWRETRFATVACCLVLAGCAPVWHETDVHAAVAERPDSVRVTTVAGESWVLAVPRMAADSVVGFTWAPSTGSARLAIPTDSLARVETYDATGRWLSLGALVVGTTVLALVSED
jgi:hypothetical protein